MNSVNPAIPQYEPPYDSPIEDAFAWELSKYLTDDAKLVPQHPVETIVGTVYLDFLLSVGNRRVGIECDGAEFHDGWRDEVRDAMIFGASAVDSLYRIRGATIVHDLYDVIAMFQAFERSAFTPRSRVVIAKLCSEWAGKRFLLVETFKLANPKAEQHEVPSEPTEPWYQVYFSGVSRHDLVVPGGRREHWQSIYKRAVPIVAEAKPRTLAELVDLMTPETLRTPKASAAR